MATNAYFAANPDVAAAFAQNSYGMTPDEFAQSHYNNYGQYEQRAAPTAPAADPLAAAWQTAEKSGDYSQIAGLLGNMSGQQLMSVYGLSPADLNYVNEKAGTSLMPISGSTLSNAAAAVNTPATLTAEIAQDLMQRSMTTGVPTSEFDKYGGYDKVQALYNQGNGTYALDKLDPAFLDRMDDIIANTGVGNLSVLKMTGEPLTKAGYQAMQNNGVNFTEADLKSMGIPYEGFLQVPKKAGSTIGTGTNGVNTAGQLTGGAQVMGPLLSGGYGGNWNARQAVGASDGSMMGAGDANYHSSLIKSLRQNSMTPFSTNAGVLMAPNQGSTTSNWKPPTSGTGGAFNPQVLNPRTASPQEIADWNAYSTYRTNSLNTKTPIVSFAEWLAGGKVDGTQQQPTTPTNPDPVYDSSLGGG